MIIAIRNSFSARSGKSLLGHYLSPMTAILQLATLVDQSLEISASQIENLETMHSVALQAEEEESGAVLAGMAIGWFMSSSAAKIDANVQQLIEILQPLDLDLHDLQESMAAEGRFPESDPLRFIQETIDLVRCRQEALQEIKSLLLRESAELEKRLSPGQLRAMEVRRDRQLRQLLDE